MHVLGTQVYFPVTSTKPRSPVIRPFQHHRDGPGPGILSPPHESARSHTGERPTSSGPEISRASSVTEKRAFPYSAWSTKVSVPLAHAGGTSGSAATGIPPFSSGRRQDSTHTLPHIVQKGFNWSIRHKDVRSSSCYMLAFYRSAHLRNGNKMPVETFYFVRWGGRTVGI